MLLDKIDPETKKQKRIHALMNEARYKARRYVFSDEVVDLIGSLLLDYPDLLLSNFQFALPPYEHCAIEFNYMRLLEAMKQPYNKADFPGDPRETDKYICFVFSGSTFTTISATDTHKYAVASLVRWSMNYGQEVMPGCRRISTGDDLSLSVTFGSTLTNDNFDPDPRAIAEICSRFVPFIDVEAICSFPKEERSKIAFEALKCCVADPRNAIVFLLWLNQPHFAAMIDTAFVPASRKMIGNKSIAYAAHHVVTLKEQIGAKRAITLLRERMPPRRHEVAAFWRNYHKNDQCEHDWPIFPDDQGRWHCARCDQFRVRVASHMRGDASRGYVTKEYKVDQ